jgi:hypothetical protein
MKKIIWSLLGAICLIAACQRYDSSNDQPILSDQQEEFSATDRTDGTNSFDFVSYAIEGTHNNICCTAQYCKYITTPLGNVLCGLDYSGISIPVGTFTFLVGTPASDVGNPTVKVRYRLKIDEVNYPLPPPNYPSPAPVTVFDGTVSDGFVPTCQARSVWINPHIIPNCNKRYNITFQIIRGLSNGTSEVCTTIYASNLNLC